MEKGDAREEEACGAAVTVLGEVATAPLVFLAAAIVRAELDEHKARWLNNLALALAVEDCGSNARRERVSMARIIYHR